MSLGITFLGTGAGGSIHRSHTAIAIDCADGTKLLLDASSGNTVTRGLNELGMSVAEYHHVLLSHHHADHMSGLPSMQLVHTRSLDGSPPLAVYGPGEVLEHAEGVCRILSPGLTVDRRGAMNAQGHLVMRWEAVRDGERTQFGPTTFAYCFPADHIPGAVGWVVESDGVKVVFSGDTRYNPTIAEVGRGARMLIHEAYSLDQDHDQAVAAAHATAGDAARSASQAGVDELIITHITNPFHENTQPLIDEARQIYQGPVSTAFDLRQVTVDS